MAIGGRGADHNYCSSGCNCIGACARSLACCDGRVDTGLRDGVAVGRDGGADDLGRRFCSEALAIRRVICSWLALSCSTAFALSTAICSWLALSCSIPCSTLARSRAIVWSNRASSGDTGAAVGATSCGVPGTEGVVCGGGSGSAAATSTADGLGCAGSLDSDEARTSCGAHRAIIGLAASP